MGADTAHREPGARVRRVGRVADVDHGQGRARRVEATETGSDREKMIIIAHLLSGIINLEFKSSFLEFIFGNTSLDGLKTKLYRGVRCYFYF